VENRNVLFPAGTKRLTIEITIPDLEKIENEGANMVLENLEVDNLEIKLTHRFNNIKGSVKARILKLDVKGGIINLTGSADNLVINSGDCWIEMDKFIAERAEIRAVNTSRLNVYVVGNMEVLSGKNSGIINHYDEL
jgi:beta-lactam-binding protein with PASTA domain